MSKRRYIQNLRSQTTIDNNGVKIPKLPEANYIKEGEIAINFATGYETIAIKNADGEIVKFDNKVDENYEPTQYNGKFETLVTETNHVKAGDTYSKAFKSVENTMSTLVDEVYKDEKAIVTTFGTVGRATGIVDAEGNISYQTKADAHYIAPANSVHEATVLLDNSLNGVETKVNDHQNQITAVKATADQNKTDIATSNTDIKNIARAAGVINAQDVIGYQEEPGVLYIGDAVSVHDATVKLDFKLQEIEDTSGHNTQDISDLAKVAGGAVRNGVEKRYEYTPEETANYIANATSVHDATVKLDIRLKQTTDTSNKNFQNIEYLANVAGAVKNVEGTYIYQSNDNTKYIAGAHSVHEATVLLDNELSKQDDTDSDIAKAIGLTKTGTKYVYKVNTSTNYISTVNSVDEATIALDSQIRTNQDLIGGCYERFNDYDERFNIINKVISKFPSIEYVDLGLPSRTRWLTCNLGATTPTGIGNYYMWGSLSPNDKTDCSWSNTPFNDGQTSKNDTVFNTATAGTRNIILYQDRLNEAFDVIYHRTHGIAKLPTEEQINELISDTNTTMNWVTKYQGTNVNGFTFTSKTNNKVLFIPAGGYRDGTSTKEIGKTMLVMSSNINNINLRIISLRGSRSDTLTTMPFMSTINRNQAIPLRGVIV